MKQCKALVHTSDGLVVHQFNEHTLAPSAAAVEALHIVNQIRLDAATIHDTPRQIITNRIGDISDAVAGQLPSLDAFRQRVHNVRHVDMAVPANPRTLGELEFPEQFKKTSDGKDYCYLFVEMNYV